jgi:hypothetical protein
LSSFDLDYLLQAQKVQLLNFRSDQAPPAGAEALLWEDPTGPLTISQVRSNPDNFYRLRLGDEIAVDIVADDRLAVTPGPDVPQLTVDHFLADQVFPRILSQRGQLVLHAGAVHDRDTAILLLGPSGSGKSTLVTSFHQSGWTLMGDDAIVIALGEGGPLARPVYPSLRLFADSIDALFSEAVVTHDMAHYSSKQRLEVAHAAKDLGPVPLAAMVFLGDDRPLAISPLTAAQACIGIIENSFALDPTDRDRARKRLELASRLANELPAFWISYPREFARLGEVRQVILSAAVDRPALPS